MFLPEKEKKEHVPCPTDKDFFAGLMEREDMHKLEEENSPPQSGDFLCENNNWKLSDLVHNLLSKDSEAQH